MIIYLFGDEVRFYFTRVQSADADGRSQYPLNKQPRQHLVVINRNQSRLICAAGSLDVFM